MTDDGHSLLAHQRASFAAFVQADTAFEPGVWFRVDGREHTARIVPLVGPRIEPRGKWIPATALPRALGLDREQRLGRAYGTETLLVGERDVRLRFDPARLMGRHATRVHAVTSTVGRAHNGRRALDPHTSAPPCARVMRLPDARTPTSTAALRAETYRPDKRAVINPAAVVERGAVCMLCERIAAGGARPIEAPIAVSFSDPLNGRDEGVTLRDGRTGEIFLRALQAAAIDVSIPRRKRR